MELSNVFLYISLPVYSNNKIAFKHTLLGPLLCTTKAVLHVVNEYVHQYNDSKTPSRLTYEEN